MKRFICLLVTIFIFSLGLVSCDDDVPEIPGDIFIDDEGGVHFPPVDYIPQ